MVREETDEETNDLKTDNVWPDMWKHMSDAPKRKEKQKWAVEKPKLDNARRLRGLYFIDPDDEEFKDIMKNARRKWKFRCQQQFLVKLCCAAVAGKPGAPLEDTRQKIRLHC